MRTLEEYHSEIEREVDFVGIKGYSHNIINFVLMGIAKDYGRKEANRAIDLFGLQRLGWEKVLTKDK